MLDVVLLRTEKLLHTKLRKETKRCLLNFFPIFIHFVIRIKNFIVIL